MVLRSVETLCIRRRTALYWSVAFRSLFLKVIPISGCFLSEVLCYISVLDKTRQESTPLTQIRCNSPPFFVLYTLILDFFICTRWRWLVSPAKSRPARPFANTPVDLTIGTFDPPILESFFHFAWWWYVLLVQTFVLWRANRAVITPWGWRGRRRGGSSASRGSSSPSPSRNRNQKRFAHFLTNNSNLSPYVGGKLLRSWRSKEFCLFRRRRARDGWWGSSRPSTRSPCRLRSRRRIRFRSGRRRTSRASTRWRWRSPRRRPRRPPSPPPTPPPRWSASPGRRQSRVVIIPRRRPAMNTRPSRSSRPTVDTS